MAENYRTTLYGEEMRCPECGEWATANFVDNGVGMQRCGPYSCDQCGWVEDTTPMLKPLFDFFEENSK